MQNSISQTLQSPFHIFNLFKEKGIYFSTSKKSILKYLSKSKERKFIINKIKIDLTESIFDFKKTVIAIDDNKFDEHITETEIFKFSLGKKCARLASMAVLNSKWKVYLFSNFLTNYFLKRIETDTLYKLAITICAIQTDNLEDENVYDDEKLQKISIAYQIILNDILQNKNLIKHLDDITLAINEIDRLISNINPVSKGLTEYEVMKNKLYFLKWQILERQ